MEETFKIFVHRITEGREEKIQEILSPDFLDVHEKDLDFQAPIKVTGVASVVEEVLVLNLTIETEAIMPCSICNHEVHLKILVPSFYHTEELSNIKGGVFDYQSLLREEILLQIPYTAECNEGDCPERAILAQYSHPQN